VAELIRVLLILTFVPMVMTAVFAFLAYSRMGYGRVGTSLCIGFVLLVASLFGALANNLLGPDEILQMIVGVVRVVGWFCLALSYVWLYADADRSIP
jgi:hypothetical protein